MLDCHEVTRLVAGDQIATMGVGARMGVWLHTRLCRHCRRYARQLHAIGEMARLLAREETSGAPLAPLASRIRAAISAAAQSPTEESP